MSSPDNSLKLLIELGLVGEEKADVAKKSLQGVGEAGQDVAKSMGVINVSQDDAAKALGKTGEKGEITHLAFRRLAHTLGAEIPGAAALMEAGFEGATEPMMGATFLLVAGIEMLRAAIEKVNKEQEQSKQIGEALADLDGDRTKAIDKTRDALEGAEVAEEVFHHNFIRNTQDAIARASELAQAILKTAIAAGEANANTGKGIAEKQIADMETAGVVSHAAALKMKEQLDLDYEQRKLARMIAQDAVEREILVNQYQNKGLQAQLDEKAEKSAETQYKTALAAKVQNDTKLDEAQGKIAGGQDVKKSLRAAGVDDESVQALREMYSNVTGKDDSQTPLEDQFHELAQLRLKRMAGAGITGPLGIALEKYADPMSRLLDKFGSQGDSNLALYEGADIDIKAGTVAKAAAQKNKPAVETGEALAKSDLEAAQGRMQKSRDEVQALKDKIAESNATNAIKEGGAKMDLNMRRASGELSDDKGIADQVQRGGPVSGVDQQKLIQDASRIAGHQVDLQTAAKIIENGANNMGIFMTQISRLATALGNFNPTDSKNLENKVNLLEGQLRSLATTGFR